MKNSLLTKILFCVFAMFYASSQVATAQVWSEDFEVNGLGVTYSVTSTFFNTVNDHYARTQAGTISNVSGPYNSMSGTFFWAGEDLDDTTIPNLGDGVANKTITFNPINVSAVGDIELRGLFATGNTGSGWDNTDQLYVEYNLDGAGWIKVMQFAAPTAASNVGLNRDTDLNGLGDGTQLTPAFQLFTADIPGTGTSLQLRIFASANSGSEEFAFDLISIFDVSAPVPGCTDPLADNYNPAATIDDGSCQYSGCTDAVALNYDPQATIDDGSCIYTLPDVVINEISYNPDDVAGFPDTSHEFIEIYNNEGSAVNLSGWSFTLGVTYTFPAATTIAAGEYIVVAVSSATFTGNGYQVFQWNVGETLSNNGETVRLVENNGLTVDEVAFDDAAPWSTIPDGSGPTLELINPSFDNNDATSWCDTGAVNGTPGAQNSCFAGIVPGCTNPIADNFNPLANQDDGSCIVGGCTDVVAANYDPQATYDDGSCYYDLPDIIINEIFYNPCVALGEDLYYEFLELYNADAVSVDLTGWTISNAISHTFGAVTIAPGEYIIVAKDQNSYLGGGYQVIQWNTGDLNNTGEAITLRNASAVLVDEVIYSDSSPWPVEADGLCPSLELIAPNLDNSDPANWQASYVPNGTPGAENSSEPTAIPATIVEIQNGTISTGSYISTSGIVTCVFSSLFTIQDGTGPYSGIWVSGNGVAVGDEVNVDAVVTESFSLTLLTGSTIVVVSSGNVLPATQVMGTLAVNDEQWEGVLVETTGACDFDNLGFGEWSINDGTGMSVIDDLGVAYTPVLFETYTVIGPLYFSFGAYKITPCNLNEIMKWGCTDPIAINYDPEAAIDDGTCTGVPVPGCTNPIATNFDPFATVDDGSCLIEGCTDPAALNYDPVATVNDGTCYFTLPNVVINEIHYNPCTAQGDDLFFEFIELYNPGATPADMTGFSFTAGFIYEFPDDFIIAPGEYIVLAVDESSYFGLGFTVLQWTADNLGNSGETITIGDSFGNFVDSVPYDNTGGWPPAANGTCSSLELIDASFDNSLPASWQASYDANGTPGAPNSQPPIPGCTYPMASNYDPMATPDDGSCIFPGCTDPLALNYTPLANLDDDTCNFEAPCPADLDGNGVVNVSDLLAFMGAFGTLCN
ncbi:MAG: lamin tail domain-containing protein [Flavobacteriales bacterium]|nr:lamin tail domain-containing protein [Flavobacteriales bacterium]